MSFPPFGISPLSTFEEVKIWISSYSRAEVDLGRLIRLKLTGQQLLRLTKEDIEKLCGDVGIVLYNDLHPITGIYISNIFNTYLTYLYMKDSGEGWVGE